ncbi:amidophosphoribosyltransferase [Nannocystis sp. ILAH1]|uniref:amidophosphoribosyltransferase n=1 Tax=unclassified Nannocystis TaxID=2627009 RepID=UPI00226E79DB|nr:MULTISPECIES: amidophosphoribosyltransferase [unclassified Nannocystis]MCY0990173.1 amidophosphoribosyltransferase [Nannocystis sp. ILAH1]MCY1069538.1 amidophosphoribosyltransferase [Nannocystis sp. RBIL2]
MCGVFGIFNHPEAANLTYLGLHALQHRGQESAGIVTSQEGTLHAVRKMGYVADVFDGAFGQLPGRIAIGHVRYTTAGGSLPKNIQPLTAEYRHGSVALGHNGNLVNAEQLREELEHDGAIFSSQSDTEVILQLLARSREPTFVERLCDALGRVQGAYSLVLVTEDKLLAVRDPYGFRPLVLGRLRNHPDCYVVASETCAFDLIEADKIRDIAPGEILVIDHTGLRSVQLRRDNRRFCVFEHVYFARPDSVLDDLAVYEARIAMGDHLAREAPVEADVVVPVPDSGVVAALGFAKASRIPFEMGLIRNHYVGRTFIEPKDSIRHFGVKLKLNPVPQVLRGKRVVVVDDSLVRGTTSRKIVKMIRAAGASEVHLRISSPPVISPCYYGIDTPTRSELIAASHTPDEIARYLTADSLAYLSPEGLSKAVRGDSGTTYCDACFSGRYPIRFIPPPGRRQLRLIEA